MGKFFRSWCKRTDGTTAIEFSLMAIPYLLLTLGIIELSLMYTTATLLEGATGSAARMIRTGQIQDVDDPEAAFSDAVCAYIPVLINCREVVVEVQSMDSFYDFADMAPQYDDDGNFVSRGFDVGGSGDRMLVRVAYDFTMMTPLVGPLLSGRDGKRTFMSTIVLQTEPYEFDGA